MLKKLNAIDTGLFLYLNGHHSAFFDPIMFCISNKWFWLPLYFLIACLIVRKYKKEAILIFVYIAITIILSDQLSSEFIKPLVGRLRPSHVPSLSGLVHLSMAGPGGLYGFVSSHATNSFALFIFLSTILKSNFRWLKLVLCLWALLVSYSRIYVGVHYPGDVICGAILGSMIGFMVASFYKKDSKYYMKLNL